MPGRAAASEPWRVCIRNTAGEPLGAGMLLGEGVVLTCAHVVTGAAGGPAGERSLPAREVLVTFDGLAGSPSARAEAIPECWAPPREDGSADVALLQLRPSAPGVPGAALRRLPAPRHRNVHAYGFPHQHPDGVWASATLAGPIGPGGEWVQLDAPPAGQLVRRGFSGAAVIDELTDAVVGMVVTAHTDEAERLSCMIPVDTLVRYVGRVADWVGADLSPSPAVIVVVGPVPKRLDPSWVAIKMTMDVTDMTTDEVRERIESRLSNSARSESAPSTDPTRNAGLPVMVALEGIGESSQPEALLHTVVKPLVEAGTEMELRFSGDSSPGLSLARQLLREENSSGLDRLVSRVKEVDAKEAALGARRSKVKALIEPVPTARSAAPGLHLRVRALESAGANVDPARVRTALASTERSAERAIRNAERASDELKTVLARYEELKGLLRGYNARATDHGFMEDAELSELYRPAAQAITARPCHIPQAETTVMAYIQAVRHRLGGCAEVLS